MSQSFNKSGWVKACLLGMYALCLASVAACTTTEELVGTPVPTQKVDPVEAMRLVQHYAIKLKYEQKLFLKDSVLYYDDCINRIRLDFETELIMDLCQARMMLVDVVEGLLMRLNNNENLFAQFCQYPITSQHLEIYIDFHSFYGLYDDPYAVGAVCLRGGISYFFAADLKDKTLNAWHDREEFYFQSRNIVQFQREGEDLYKPEKKDLTTLENELLNIH